MHHFELIEKARKNDEKAFSELVKRFRPTMERYASKILGNEDLARDAVQEAFFEAYRTLGSLRENAAFDSWLKHITFKHCNRITRKKQPEFTDNLDATADSETPEQVFEKKENLRIVEKALKTLTDPERKIIQQRYFEDLSPEEIARRTGLPHHTVKNILHRSRKKLRWQMLNTNGIQNLYPLPGRTGQSKESHIPVMLAA